MNKLYRIIVCCFILLITSCKSFAIGSESNFLDDSNFANSESTKFSDNQQVSTFSSLPKSDVLDDTSIMNNKSANVSTNYLDITSSSSFNSSSTSTSSQEKRQFNVETVVEHYYYNNGSLTQWNQSMAIYGDRIFLFLDTAAELAYGAGYSFVVMDLNTKNIIFKGQTPTRNCHNNNAQFLDVFYSSDDNYPLLLLSRGDYPSSSDAGKCYVVRITEKESIFKLTIIKTISCTLQQATYNGSWVSDKLGNLFLYTMTIGDWQTPELEGNRLIIYRFDMFDPKDPTDIELSVNDVKGSVLLDYCILQGADSYCGKLLLPISGYTKINGIFEENVRNVVAVVNPFSGIIETTIDSDYMENEGISIYNGKMYVSSKNGGGNSETLTPTFRIQSFVF